LVCANSFDNSVSVLENLSALAFLKGDLNEDKQLTSSDLVLLFICVFLKLGNCALGVADLDCDGEMTSTDLVLEQNAVFLGIAFPACP
jgi:hypothetical protein